MANIKELIQSIEAADSSFDEKLAAINQMEETLVAMRQQEETAVQENVDLIVEAIKVMEDKVNAQLEIAKSIVPEKGDKGDKGLDGKQGKDGRDGKDGKDGINGKDGADGKDGVSVTDAKIDFDGSLIISLSTGQEINVGEVVAPELQEKIKLVTSGGAGTVLPSQTGNANKYLKTDGTALSWAAGDGTGTVTSVGTSGTVNGITLTGGPITSSGTVTLGGTLSGIGNGQLTNSSITFGSTAQALGSTVSGLSGVTIDNGAVGGTTPAAVTATTLIGGGGSANYGQLTGGATGKAVQFQTLGSDSNVSLAIQPKGTGAIDLAAGSSGVNISNGGTVTAITKTLNGSGYTSVPSVAISAPTTAGGVQATANVYMFVATATVSSGGSGYLVGDVLTVTGGTGTAATLTVATLSGSAVATVTISNVGFYSVLPTNPVSVTGGTGSGATFNLASSVNSVVVGTAGSGYVEQPTVSFSGGGGSGAAAYATVGSGTVVKTLGQTVSFYTPQGEMLRLQDGANGQTGNYLQVSQTTGSDVLLSAQGSSASPSLYIGAKGTTGGIRFTASGTGTEQMRIAPTASAVNYVQVTGGATGSNPIISSQGSDASRGLGITSKSTGNIGFYSGATAYLQLLVNGSNSAVNYMQVAGAVTGAAPTLSVGGTDADIDLTLTPKGAGAVRFGTYTVSALLAVAGYITIKDSGGTTRRLLVG
jgi:hypothetical protein